MFQPLFFWAVLTLFDFGRRNRYDISGCRWSLKQLCFSDVYWNRRALSEIDGWSRVDRTMWISSLRPPTMQVVLMQVFSNLGSGLRLEAFTQSLSLTDSVADGVLTDAFLGGKENHHWITNYFCKSRFFRHLRSCDGMDVPHSLGTSSSFWGRSKPNALVPVVRMKLWIVWINV